ncbi:MAG: C45 family peptidase [Candidatus Competibacteraceae bacterium]|nr:C45 family peptidase [Candidatus Competibacteraceae bacterium]
MQMTFEAIAEARPGTKWQSLFRRFWPGYRNWYLSRGGAHGPSLAKCERQLARYMPELLPTYERLVELADHDSLAARFLTGYRPPAYLVSCSQAVWPQRQGPLLIRNFDLAPDINEGLILHSAWNGQGVIATGECLWGASDGVNQRGLAASLTFGGRRVIGDGFGIPLIIRYLLETCSSTEQAVVALCRIPSHMAYNVTVVDREGDYATVMVAPDRPARVTRRRVATNHQEKIDWPERARFTRTLERERFLCQRLLNPRTTARSLIQDFLKAPLYSQGHAQGFGTLYTAVYNPARGEAEYHWPDGVWRQSLSDFQEGERQVRFAQPQGQPHQGQDFDLGALLGPALGVLRQVLDSAAPPGAARRFDELLEENRRSGQFPWQGFAGLWAPSHD